MPHSFEPFSIENCGRPIWSVLHRICEWFRRSRVPTSVRYTTKRSKVERSLWRKIQDYTSYEYTIESSSNPCRDTFFSFLLIRMLVEWEIDTGRERSGRAKDLCENTDVDAEPLTNLLLSHSARVGFRNRLQRHWTATLWYLVARILRLFKRFLENRWWRCVRKIPLRRAQAYKTQYLRQDLAGEISVRAGSQPIRCLFRSLLRSFTVRLWHPVSHFKCYAGRTRCWDPIDYYAMAVFLACLSMVRRRHVGVYGLPCAEPDIVTGWYDRRWVGFRAQGTVREEEVLQTTAW